MKLSKSSLIAGTVLTAALLGGCVSSSELADVKSQAAADAAAAQQTADAANAKAEQALQAARAAEAKAQAAMDKANELDAKLDRMFKKSMMK